MDPVLIALSKVIFFLPLFLVLSILVFYTPGYLLINKVKTNLRNDEKIVLSVGTGFIIFLLIAAIFGLLNLRFIVPVVLLAINLYAFIKFKFSYLLPFLVFLKDRWLLLLLLLGTAIEGFINFPSGFPYSTGHLYWSSQGHDGLWHIAVIEAIKQNFPPSNPLFSGVSLFNYHFFSDIVTAEFNRIFPFFGTLDLYFRYFSFLISFLIGLSAYSFLTTWKKNKSVGMIGIFFSYFVGSFGYLILVIQRRGFFGGETIFWAAQGNTIIGNPPHAFCYFLIPVFFLSLYHYLKEKRKVFLLICFLTGGFLLGFKVSAAAVLIAGLLVASFFSILTGKNRGIIFLTLIISLSNFIVFKLITKEGGSFLIFEPWWFIRTMIVVSDRVNWLDLELKRQFYIAQGGIRGFLRVTEFETIAFLLFLLGNLGMRIIGFWDIFKSLINKTLFKDTQTTALFVAMITGFFVPVFFVQKGVAYNLVQFMQYFLLLFGFFAAVSLYNFLHFLKKKPLQIIAIIIFTSLSLPTVIGNLLDFYGKNPLAIVSNQEIEALVFLKSQSGKKDIILTKPFNPYSKGLYQSQPWPIYAWDSTGYVSAYTGQQSYYTDEGQMRILAVGETEKRLKLMEDFFSPKTPIKQKEEFLANEKIKFIYLRIEETNKEQKENFTTLGLREIFANNEVSIYQK